MRRKETGRDGVRMGTQYGNLKFHTFVPIPIPLPCEQTKKTHKETTNKQENGPTQEFVENNQQNKEGETKEKKKSELEQYPN